MQRLEQIVHGLIIALCEWILKRITPKPLDCGKHNMLARREDGSLTPVTDDDLWDMMDKAAEEEDKQADWWLMTFARAAQKYGEGIYTNN
jgi:hypothetical protein